MNSISIVGRLTKDPELRFTANGKAVASLRVAMPRRDRNADPVYIDVVTWGEQAKVCADYLTKGRQIAVTGRLEDRHWTTDDDAKRSTFEIVANTVDFLGDAKRKEEPQGVEPPVEDE